MAKCVIAVVILIAIAFVVWLFIATQQPPTIVTIQSIIEKQRQEIQEIQIPINPKYNFSISLLKLLQREQPNENIFYSPYSVYRTLLLMYFGAGGDTENELKTVLGLNGSKEDVYRTYNLQNIEQAERFKDESIEFTSVDKIYASNKISMIYSAKEMFNTSIEQLNFTEEPDQCIKHINRFIAEKTKKQITDALGPDSIGPQTLLVAINAVYFQASWKTNFINSKTSRQTFYKQDGNSVDVDMMTTDGTFACGLIQHLNAEWLKMPYVAESANENIHWISMLVIKSLSTTIDDILNNLTTIILEDIKNSYVDNSDTSISIHFPKFAFEKQSKLNPALQKMGLNNLFSSNANFSRFFGSKNYDYKFEIEHTAKIEVDEKGSKAAAVTISQYVSVAHRHRCKGFTADHPFVFIIYDNKNEDLLFAGTYHGPNQN